MDVQTTRFGTVQLDDRRVITFTNGLLGFANHKTYALLQPRDEGVFYWLQSLDSPELAFVVTDPVLWVPEYEATLRHDQVMELDVNDHSEVQVLVIVNKYEDKLTANLQGPLIVNLSNHRAMQLVLADARWTTRHDIVHLCEPAQAVAV